LSEDIKRLTELEEVVFENTKSKKWLNLKSICSLN
jgi:hypothetical protein